MDDLEDGEGVAVQGEGGVATLENKMKNLNVISQKDVSQNSKTTVNNQSFNHQGINKQATKNQVQKPIVYGFKSEVLSGGRRPEVQCQVCKKDGHMSSRCPDLRKPTLKALPHLNPRVVELVTAVCSKARGN